jgi:hypothetical protein
MILFNSAGFIPYPAVREGTGNLEKASGPSKPIKDLKQPENPAALQFKRRRFWQAKILDSTN